ncbi:MAG: endonuclease/exonuclease/phosphatase family protein [Anaerolineales bacterium]|nr:endonuclease/exonuclease/phosphatase family protein [Anaerolineales bacterium]
MTRVRLVTVNILNDRRAPTRWEERRPLLADGLRQLAPDLIALQEVRLPDRRAHWLAEQLGDYSVHVCPKTGSWAAHEGIAILSRLSVEEHATLDLRTQSRVAQLVRVNVAGRDFGLANGHFFWWTGDHPERVKQIRLLLDWLREWPEDVPLAVCGDFNAEPYTTSIRLMRERFASAYALVHGREPEYTAPAPLQRPVHPLQRLVVGVMSVIANRTLTPWRGTLDYIFVNGSVRVQECHVVLNEPAPHDPTLYPSDHFGLAATLELN